MQTVTLSPGEQKFLLNLITEGNRLDGRDYMTSRSFTVQKNTLAMSPASCRVLWGTSYGETTEVIVSVSTEVAKTENSQPRISVKAMKGSFNSAESDGICQMIQATLTHILENSGCLDPAKFVVVNSPYSWKLFIEVLVVKAAGAVYDSAMIGIRETLSDLTFPQLIITPGETLAELHFDIDETKESVKLIDIAEVPFAVSFAATNNHLVVDPTPVEVTVIQSLIVAGLSASGMILGLNYIGGCGIKSWVLGQITGKTKEILTQLNK